MGDTSLQDRLRDHAKAFDGLMSLIPAKMYYGEDTSDQWKKKKQTKAEAKAAKRGKLDPDSELNRNAKEVMDERARNKRKLRDMQEEDDDGNNEEDDGDDVADIVSVEKEKPREGMKAKPLQNEEKGSKKQKTTEENNESKTEEQSKKEMDRAEKKLLRKDKRVERKQLKTQNPDGTSASAADSDEPVNDVKGKREGQKTKSQEKPPEKRKTAQPSTETEADGVDKDGDLQAISVPGLVDEATASTPASPAESPVFDTDPRSDNASVEPVSTTTSISSTIPPSEKPKLAKLAPDTAALRARLAARIEALRAARKADNDSRPNMTRQELIEDRRKKQAQRKAHKKEMRRLAKEEEDRKREEALASARNSPGSMLSPRVGTGLDDGATSTHFAFGRVTFADGTQMSHDLSYTKEAAAKKKGPADPKTALTKLEAQKKRIARLDEDKRKEVLEKETWLAARRRAEGEKVRDDETLLKKAVKRKEKAKKKSANEWKERTKGVEKAIQDRQKKREANLRERREQKAAGKGGKRKPGPTKKKNRPGFEGSFGVIGGGGSGGGGKRK